MTADDRRRAAPDTVVLIHGLWMTPLCWEHWIVRYADRGYQVLAPAWPGMEVGVEGVRREKDRIAGLGVSEIVDHYERIIRGLPKPPILMGHSFGGAFVQILLDRGLGAAGVAIDSAPVKGVRGVPVSTLRSTFPVLWNPLNYWRAVPLSLDQFHYAFTNTLTEQKSLEVYERYHIPAPARVLFQGALANFNPWAATKVDFGNTGRAPLLFISGGDDHIVPPSVNLENAGRYLRSGLKPALREFPGRSHFTLGQDGWETVADFALDWAVKAAG